MNISIKRCVSFLAVIAVLLTALFITPTVKASAAAMTKYSVSYTDNAVKVTLTATKSGSKIYYTTNGKKPDTSSKLYTKCLSSGKSFLLRAIEVDKNGKTVSSLKLRVTPKVSRPKMYLKSSGRIRLSVNTNGAVIRYTTDGSAPDENSPVYNGLIPIGEGGIVTARAYKDGWTTSDTVSYQHLTKSESKDYIEGVFELVNKERKDRGLSEVTLDEKLCEAAQVRAKELIKVFDHVRPDGKDCYSVYAEYGIVCNAKGENVARGQLVPESVMSSWMKSEGHRDNILKSQFSKIGIGHVKSGQYDYWVQLFAG